MRGVVVLAESPRGPRSFQGEISSSKSTRMLHEYNARSTTVPCRDEGFKVRFSRSLTSNRCFLGGGQRYPSGRGGIPKAARDLSVQRRKRVLQEIWYHVETTRGEREGALRYTPYNEKWVNPCTKIYFYEVIIVRWPRERVSDSGGFAPFPPGTFQKTPPRVHANTNNKMFPCETF